jgi:hypothetical protein
VLEKLEYSGAPLILKVPDMSEIQAFVFSHDPENPAPEGIPADTPFTDTPIPVGEKLQVVFILSAD